MSAQTGVIHSIPSGVLSLMITDVTAAPSPAPEADAALSTPGQPSRAYLLSPVSLVAGAVADAAGLIVFLLALYLLHAAALIFSALGPAPRGSLAGRLAARTRYALWRLERRASSADA